MSLCCNSVTSAKVDLAIDNNASWEDAFQFSVPEGGTWDFADKSFQMDIKVNKDDTAVLFTLSSGNDRIIVDDVVNRVLHFDVPADDLQLALYPGRYVYDLVMIDNGSPAIRTVLMHGKLNIKRGITQP